MEYSKMNAHWKDWWLRALRGGNYKQCQRMLRNSKNECCCFGVLGDGMEPTTWEFNNARNNYGIGKEGSPYRLPERLRMQAGISFDVLQRLERMNDNGRSFAEIADWVEANL